MSGASRPGLNQSRWAPSTDQLMLTVREVPAISILPQELIQHVFVYLNPFDFNAARHTCRAWMLASLDPLVLRRMLKRGGWWSGVVSTIGFDPESSAVLDSWLLSQFLARECALRPGWTGNGTSVIEPAGETTEASMQRTGLVQTYSTDMTELSSSVSDPSCNHGCGPSFTVSICGRFLLIAEGCVIYVYELHGSRIRPITIVICPRRVLAVSMDTSFQRYAVAALLDSRIGIVCDLDFRKTPDGPPSRYSRRSIRTLVRNANQHEGNSASAREIPTESIMRRNPPFSRSDAANMDSPLDSANTISSILIRSSNQNICLQGTACESQRYAVNRTWRNIVAPFAHLCLDPDEVGSIPISKTPLSVYYSLCSPDDPPRCVAICPSRRCIAFGCTAGIELHWIDPISRNNLMKWFPLTAPSDFIYFVPCRTGIDNPNKLRLMSSKAGPSQRGGVERSTSKRLRQSEFYWSYTRGGLRSDGPTFDHFFAVPISDGIHYIFTDPFCAALALGSDGPYGGPTRFARKILLLPPAHLTTLSFVPPTIYSVGKDLRCGVRVAAVYGDHIVLFCIPPDLFKDLTKLSGTISPEPRVVNYATAGEWRNWWNAQGHETPNLRLPIEIRGVEIAESQGIVDIAVQTSPDLAIWALSIDGIARTWQVGSAWRKKVMHRVVERNGAVRDAVDPQGDWIMRDAPPPRAIDPHAIRGAFFHDDGDVDMIDRDEDGQIRNTDEYRDVSVEHTSSLLDGQTEASLFNFEFH